MTIVDCKVYEIYTIKKIHTSGILRQRLVSFGILKGVKIQYLTSTRMKDTYEVQVGKTTIALRKEEAQKIEVEQL